LKKGTQALGRNFAVGTALQYTEGFNGLFTQPTTSR
jgi:hypothetical protein